MASRSNGYQTDQSICEDKTKSPHLTVIRFGSVVIAIFLISNYITIAPTLFMTLDVFVGQIPETGGFAVLELSPATRQRIYLAAISFALYPDPVQSATKTYKTNPHTPQMQDSQFC